MAASAIGVIFSNMHEETVPELVRRRTMASIPFGGRYRLIDFALSNMVNSGIERIGVITKYNGSSALVMIPEKINGVSVTGIGDRCFADSSIKSVYIPGYVTYIGNKAFENCLYLQSVNFVDMKARVTIGTAAFQNCPSLTTVHLPAAKLSDTVFGNCTALSSVSFAEGTEKIGMYCFSNCKALASVSIPESVNLENIGQDIFFGCDRGKLTVITPYGSDAETYAVNAGVTTREP